MGSFCLKIVWCVLMALVFFHQPAAHAASCVPVKAGQDEAFGNPYWQSGYYKNSLMHPHTHETYPEVELTWSQSDASGLAGYEVVAEDAYTTDGSLSQAVRTLAKMPLYVTVGKATRQVRMPNMASQFRTWVVYALFTNGSSEKIAQTSMICGEDVRENRSNDAPYVYVELVDTYGGTYEPEAISFSDWRDYGCHYALPDEYARGESADYVFTGSWNWGDPVVGALVDDSYDVPGLSGLRRECESDKPTAHLAEGWDVTPVRFMSEAGDDQVAESPAQPTEPPATPTGLTATATNGQVVLTWDDPGDDTITGYLIKRRSRKGGNYGNWSTLEAHTGSATTTYTDDTVLGNARYAYRIKAINEHGLSGISTRSDWVRINAP